MSNSRQPANAARTDRSAAPDRFASLIKQDAAQSRGNVRALVDAQDQPAPRSRNNNATEIRTPRYLKSSRSRSDADTPDNSKATQSDLPHTRVGAATPSKHGKSDGTAPGAATQNTEVSDKADSVAVEPTISASVGTSTATATPVAVAVAVPVVNIPANAALPAIAAASVSNAKGSQQAAAPAVYIASSQSSASAAATGLPATTGDTATAASAVEAAAPDNATATTELAATAEARAASVAKAGFNTAVAAGSAARGTAKVSDTSSDSDAPQTILAKTKMAGAQGKTVDGTSTAESTPVAAKADSSQLDAAQPSTHERVAAAASEAQADASASGSKAANNLQPLQVQSSATTSQLNVATATTSLVPVNALAMQIAVTAQTGKSRFEIRLDPAELGRIDVRIDIDRQGQITSHLTVEKPETLAMLRQDAPQLQRALDDAGFKTGNSGLQFSLRDQGSSGQNTNNDSGGQSHRLIVHRDDVLPAETASRTYGRMLASSSGVDIRV